MALQDTDNLIVQRGSTLNKVEIQNMATIQDTDLLVVGRGSESYKITGQEFLDSVGPKGTVDTPSIIAPADNAGEMVSAESDEIIGVVSDTTSADWYATATKVTANPANSWDKAFNGTQSSLSDGIYGTGQANPEQVFTFNPPLPAATYVFAVYFGAGDIAGSTNFLFINGENKLITDSNWSGNTSSSYQTYTYTGSLTSIGLGNGGMYLNRVSANGTWMVAGNDLGLSSTTLTLSGNKDLTVFKPLDDVQQDSGYTPQTSAITNVAADTPSAGETTLTLTDDTDLANFRVGDVITQKPDGTAHSGKVYANSGNTLPDVGTPPAALSKLVAYDADGWVGEALSWDTVLPTTGGRIGVYESDALSGPWLRKTSYNQGATINGGSDWSTKKYVAFEGVQLTPDPSPGDHCFNLTNIPVGVTSYDVATGEITDITGTTITLSKVVGEFEANGTNYAIGPDTTPATGTVASTDPAANTMTLSVSDETFPKRWIVNQGKYVKGEETPSSDAAPDADGLVIQSSAFASTPVGSLGHTSSDWQITLKTDTAYSSPVDAATDSSDLTQWEPSGLENDTAYRCRVRHKSGAIVSDWSEDSTFKTAKGSELNTSPGDIWVLNDGGDSVTMHPGKFVSAPEKIISVGWGDKALAIGLSGQLYISTLGASFGSLAPVDPVVGAKYMGAGQLYAGYAFLLIREDDRTIDILNYNQAFVRTLTLPSDVEIKMPGWSPNGTSNGWFWVLGENGVIYSANDLHSNVTSFVDVSSTEFGATKIKSFAVPVVSLNKIYVIDENDILYECSYTGATPGSALSSKTQVGAYSSYKQVACRYDGSVFALSLNNEFEIITPPPGDGANPTGNLPVGFNPVEIACGYYNVFVRGSDGSIVYSIHKNLTDTSGNVPPGVYGEWAKVSTLPKPCPGFTTSKWSGSGYDYGFIIP